MLGWSITIDHKPIWLPRNSLIPQFVSNKKQPATHIPVQSIYSHLMAASTYSGRSNPFSNRAYHSLQHVSIFQLGHVSAKSAIAKWRMTQTKSTTNSPEKKNQLFIPNGGLSGEKNYEATNWHFGRCLAERPCNVKYLQRPPNCFCFLPGGKLVDGVMGKYICIDLWFQIILSKFNLYVSHV